MKIFSLILYFIFATLLTTALPFSGLLMPLILILSTALFVAMCVRWNLAYSLFSAAFSGVLTYFLLNSVSTAAVFPLITLISAIGIYLSLKAKANIKTILLSGTVVYFVLIIAVYLLYGGSFIADMVNMAKTVMFESLDSVVMSIPADSVQAVNEIKQVYELYFENLKVIAPSIILSMIFLISYFSIKVSGHFAKDNELFNSVPPFSELRAPAFLVIVAAVAYACQLIESGFLSGLMANVFMALSVYYTLCGFSLIDFFAKYRLKSLAARLTVYIIGFIILTLVSVILYFANPILIAMFGGIIDSLFNYRARIRGIKGK